MCVVANGWHGNDDSDWLSLSTVPVHDSGRTGRNGANKRSRLTSRVE